MKANSHIKFANIFALIQLNFDAIDLPKIGINGSIFATHSPTVVEEIAADGSTVILIDRENSGNRNLQKHQLARRHHSIDWRWQSHLLKWFDRSLLSTAVGGL